MSLSVPLTIRRIRPDVDAPLCYANYRDAAVATFGQVAHHSSPHRYVPWLRSRCEEFPDGHLLAFLDDQCAGQLELQVPYGLATGYINLFYVSPLFRRQRLGTHLHAVAERYFRSWEATTVDLDVSPHNLPAIAFYRSLGYHPADGGPPPLQRMTKRLLIPST
jgi:ribosomal protein S18 acetylase RimI-like enzyme